jgi:small subunit ribosomal protein S20
MPNTDSGRKRLRQNKERNLRNRAVKSELKTYTKHVLSAVESGDKNVAREKLQSAQAKLDKAVKYGVLHKNTVSRRKSSLARKVQEMS